MEEDQVLLEQLDHHPSLATGRQGIAGSGTSTAGLAFGKNPPGNGLTEEFTGETTALNLKTITDS